MRHNIACCLRCRHPFWVPMGHYCRILRGFVRIA